jgi:hypothetical protein
MNLIEQMATIVDDTLWETDDVIFIADDSEIASTKHDSSETDNKSVTTDANDKLKFPSLLHSAKVAVDAQAISQTFYDFEQIVPKLNEWQEYLKMVTTFCSVDCDHAIQFKATFRSIKSID